FAARPEFGIFSKEMEIIAKKTIGGASFAQTLMRLNSRFHSRILKRTISLIIQGLASGGEMAEILERTAWDVRRMQLLQKEISASLLMYTIFIVFAAVIGAPALYALSFKLIEMITHIWAGITAGGLEISKLSQQSGMLLITPTPPGVKPFEYYYFGVASTALTAVMASFITACISTGSARNGFKYIPFFLIGALGVFFGVTYLFDKMFAGLTG
ncbi:MAG: type II secretion system F family protein, partial [Candidatus Micrarchaeota archaeon]